MGETGYGEILSIFDFDGLGTRLLRALRVPRLRVRIRKPPTGSVLLLLVLWLFAIARVRPPPSQSSIHGVFRRPFLEGYSSFSFHTIFVVVALAVVGI